MSKKLVVVKNYSVNEGVVSFDADSALELTKKEHGEIFNSLETMLTCTQDSKAVQEKLADYESDLNLIFSKIENKDTVGILVSDLDSQYASEFNVSVSGLFGKVTWMKCLNITKQKTHPGRGVSVPVEIAKIQALEF